MKRSTYSFVICITLVFNLTLARSAVGRAFDNPGIGIKAVGMGFVAAGIADDAAAVYHNPAGLAYNERNVLYYEIYAYYTFTDIKFEANSITDKSDGKFIIPGFFVSKTYDNCAFGFGFYTPFAGGGASYDNFQGSPYDLETFAGWSALTFSAAYKLRQNLSVGVGISMYIGEMESEFFDPTLGALVEREYDGYSGYGAHIGFMYKPTTDLGIGLTIRSPIQIEMDGTEEIAGFKSNSELEFKLPSYFTIGLGYILKHNLELGFSVTYMLYNHLDKLTFTTSNIETEEETHYTNSWMLGVGVEYITKRGLIYRAGMAFLPQSTKEKGLVPVSNDVDILTPRIGIAYNITDSIELNILAFYAYGFERRYMSRKYDQDYLALWVAFRGKY